MPKNVPSQPYDRSATDVRTAKLASKRRLVPPSFYDRFLDMDQTIPYDTEGALILLNSGAKQKAVAYMKAFSEAKTSQATNDYNDLLQEFADHQVTVSDSISADLKQVTGKFQAFRSTVLQSGDVDSMVSTGMTRPLQSMVASLGRLGKKESREVFHKAFNSVAVATYAKADGEPLKRELRSWVRVFVSYP